MKTLGKIISKKSAPEDTARMVQIIFACKWSLTVYQLLKKGVNRPGQMVKNVEGLSTKVLNECLRKNTDFGILERVSYNEIPPRVEYKVTVFGTKFLRILDDLDALQQEIDASNDNTNV